MNKKAAVENTCLRWQLSKIDKLVIHIFLFLFSSQPVFKVWKGIGFHISTLTYDELIKGQFHKFESSILKSRL